MNIEAVKDKIEEGKRKGLTLSLQHVLAASDATIPHETGHLETTGDYDIDDSGDDLRGSVYYDTVYARRQHEEMDWTHDAGRRAKYLELAALEELATIEAIMGQAMKASLAG